MRVEQSSNKTKERDLSDNRVLERLKSRLSGNWDAGYCGIGRAMDRVGRIGRGQGTFERAWQSFRRGPSVLKQVN